MLFKYYTMEFVFEYEFNTGAIRYVRLFVYSCTNLKIALTLSVVLVEIFN